MCSSLIRPHAYVKEHVRVEAEQFARIVVPQEWEKRFAPPGAERRVASLAPTSEDVRRALRAAAPERVWASAEKLLSFSVAPSPDSVVAAVEAALDTADSVARGAWWWLIARAWSNSGCSAGIARSVGRLLASRFAIYPAYEDLGLVASSWLYDITAQVHASQRSLEREIFFSASVDRLAAELCGTIDSNAEAAASFLDDAREASRLAAIAVLDQAVKKPSWFGAKMRELAMGDPNERVREAAVGSFSRLYISTRDASALSFLAELVRARSQPPRLRFAAYQGLFVVAGMPEAEWPMFRVLKESRDAVFRFFDGSGDEWPVEIDWPFVSSFLGIGGPQRRSPEGG